MIIGNVRGVEFAAIGEPYFGLFRFKYDLPDGEHQPVGIDHDSAAFALGSECARGTRRRRDLSGNPHDPVQNGLNAGPVIGRAAGIAAAELR